MTDMRTNKCVFVANCITAQLSMADGLVRKFPAMIRPIIQFCLDNDISIFQMPCPEMRCAAGGLGRSPHGKDWYENNGLREVSVSIANDQVTIMKMVTTSSNEILAIMGVEFSPACAITYMNRGPVIYKDQGIYIEELSKRLKEEGLNIPFLGVNQRAHKKLDQQLNMMLQGTLRNNRNEEISVSSESNVIQGNLFEK